MSPQSKEWKLDPASFVVVANRLPVDRVEGPDGTADWRPSPGGLVTAFDPIMHKRSGAWVGWHGAADEELEPFEDDGLILVPVPLSSSDVAEYYEGFSNATLWPLYHDAVATPEFRRDWWETYVAVNQRFADYAALVAAEDAVVWVQDYQLQLVPQMLRRQRPDLRIGFFLHIPFPPRELFVQLPWRRRSGRALGRGSGGLSTARRRPELCPAGPATARSGDPTGSHPDA
jgi:trehalose 6-phosphate synthase